MHPQCSAGEDSAAEDRTAAGAAKEKKMAKARAAANAKAVSRCAANLAAAMLGAHTCLQHVGTNAIFHPDHRVLPSLRHPLDMILASMSMPVL